MPNQNIWEQLGLSQDEWDALPAEDQTKLVETAEWTEKPCAICDKAVQVKADHEGQAWCMEHAGKWSEAQDVS